MRLSGDACGRRQSDRVCKGVGGGEVAGGSRTHFYCKEVVWAPFSHFSKLALTGCWGWEQGTVLLGLRDSPGALIGPPQFALVL